MPNYEVHTVILAKGEDNNFNKMVWTGEALIDENNREIVRDGVALIAERNRVDASSNFVIKTKEKFPSLEFNFVAELGLTIILREVTAC